MENQTTAMTDNAETYTYYLGDMCYVMTDEEWDTACAQIATRYDIQQAENNDDDVDFQCWLEPENLDIFNEHSGKPFVAMPTLYGDGVYNDRMGNPYSVDSGTIGMINTNYLEDTDLLQKALVLGLGHLITVTEPIDASECHYDDGVLCFGSMHSECVEIDTAD